MLGKVGYLGCTPESRLAGIGQTFAYAAVPPTKSVTSALGNSCLAAAMNGNNVLAPDIKGRCLIHVGMAGLCSAFHVVNADNEARSEEHTSELQSLMRISYAVFCLQ